MSSWPARARAPVALPFGSPRERAERAVSSWLAAIGGDWRVADAGELQGETRAGSSGQAVFHFQLEGPARLQAELVAKCLHREQSLAAARIHSAVHVALLGQQGPLAVPRPLHLDATQAVLLQERARGRCLAEFGESEGPALGAALEDCGRALRELHELPLDVLGPVGQPPANGALSVAIPAQLATLIRPAPIVLAGRSPHLRERVLRVTQQLIGCESDCGPVPAVPLHRDVHPRQLFVEEGRVHLIDWDLCGAGDPALDLANLLMHVELRWPALAPGLQLRLLEGWWSAGTPGGALAAARTALAQRIHLYRAFHALRRACKAWRIATGHDEEGCTDEAVALHAAGGCLVAAEQHLNACRRSLAGHDLPSLALPAEDFQP
jgi:aminoglycoside phosphotransferase (APT) family kinase protein